MTTKLDTRWEPESKLFIFETPLTNKSLNPQNRISKGRIDEAPLQGKLQLLYPVEPLTIKAEETTRQ